jgi:hypothetical protein
MLDECHSFIQTEYSVQNSHEDLCKRNIKERFGFLFKDCAVRLFKLITVYLDYHNPKHPSNIIHLGSHKDVLYIVINSYVSYCFY